MAYDRAGRSVGLTDASGTRTFGYHGSGQLQDETYTSGLLSGFSVNRTFDALFRLDSLAVPSVSSVSYGYDAASRLQTVTSGANTATYAYAANSALVESVTFANNGAARLTTLKTYDRLNRLAAIVNTLNAQSSALSHAYTYNAANQRTRTTREDNASWNYAYDVLGQVTGGSKSLADGTPALGLNYSYAYDDIGNRKTATANGATTTFTANSLNEYAQRTVPGVVDVLGAAAADASVMIDDGQTVQLAPRQGEIYFKQLTVNNASATQTVPLRVAPCGDRPRPRWWPRWCIRRWCSRRPRPLLTMRTGI